LKKQMLWNRDFILICCSNFFLFMTFYCLAVTLPMFVMDELKGTQQAIGLAMTVFVIAGVIFRPLAGKWLDELNRKKILFVSLLLFLVCTVFYLGIKSMSALLLLRIGHGIGFGLAATSLGAIAVDLVPDHRKGEGIGYFTLFMSLAMVIGPFVGLTIMNHSTSFLLFIVCTIFSLLSFIFGWITRIPQQTSTNQIKKSWQWHNLIELKAIPIALSGSILAFSYGAISTFISVYAKELGLQEAASYFFIVFATMIILPRPITGKLFDRLGEHVLVYPGITLFTIGMFGLSQAHTTGIFLISGALIGLGYGALLPSFQAIAIKASPSHRRGLATATYFVFFDSGYGIGSYVLGIIAAKTSYHTMYFIAGIVVACTVIIYYGLHHRKTRTKQTPAQEVSL
jgi:MFS family permease